MRLIDADRLKEEIVEAGQRSTRYRIGEFWELNRNEIWKASESEEWVEKCLSCKHAYRCVDDADTLYCRCRRYEKHEKETKDDRSRISR